MNWRIGAVILNSAVTIMTLGTMCYAWVSGGWAWQGASVFLSTIWLLIGCVTADIVLSRASSSHVIRTLLAQYLMVRIIPLIGRYRYWGYARICNNTEVAQGKLLAAILKKNSNTLYGQKYRFYDISDKLEFMHKHPLTTHVCYEDYISRIENGENGVLTKDDVVFIATTSGTTGKNKNFAITSSYKPIVLPEMLMAFHKQLSQMGMRRVLHVRYKPKIYYTKCGLQVGGLGSYMSPTIPYTVTPQICFSINGEKPALYVHALFGLAEPDIGMLDAILAPLCYSFFKTIEEHWGEICSDIERGQLSLDLVIPDEIRYVINSSLKPNPERAEFLRQEFAKGFHGIAKRVWPDIVFVNITTTGSFAHYGKLLTEKHLCGVKHASFLHIATEGLIGVNVTSGEQPQYYTLLPHVNFYEFIPVKDVEKKQPPTVTLEQVELGKSYEVVVTHHGGLYRYRLGDVITIVDFFNNCPVYRFEYRLNQMLNVLWEKTPENIFYEAIRLTEKQWGNMHLIDYTTAESVVLEELRAPEMPVFYVVFLEIEGPQPDARLSEEQKIMLDTNLCSSFQYYKELRSKGSIARIQVVQVKSGTFLRLKSLLIAETQNLQFKMPRVLRREDFLKFLLDERLDP